MAGTWRFPVLTLLALLAGPGLARAETRAKVSFLEGTATRISGEQRAPLAMGAEVVAGDEVTTGPKSRLELVLEDGSVVRLGPESDVLVQKLAFAPESQSLTARFKLALGQMWSHVEKLRPGATYEVETERAVAGVRGTEFRVDSSKEGGSVEVYHGRVAVAGRGLAFLGEGDGEPGSPIIRPAAAGAREVMVEPGKHLRLDREGMRLFRQPAARDDFARFVVEQPRPDRVRFFDSAKGPEREPVDRKLHDPKIDRRDDRRDRVLRHRVP